MSSTVSSSEFADAATHSPVFLDARISGTSPECTEMAGWGGAGGGSGGGCAHAEDEVHEGPQDVGHDPLLLRAHASVGLVAPNHRPAKPGVDVNVILRRDSAITSPGTSAHFCRQYERAS